MIRKLQITGLFGLGLLLAGAQPGPRHRIAASAQNFQQYFRNLNDAGQSLNPVERFLFSLALATANTPPASK